MDGCKTMVCERALAELAAGVAAWRPDVPAYGDLRDAAKELIYLLVSTAQTGAARLQRVMHADFFPAFPDPDVIDASHRSRIESILKPLGGHRRMTGYIIGVGAAFHARGLRFDDDAMRRLERNGELWIFLETVKGIGPKIIECLRVFAFDLPGLPLDTHNARVLFRFGVFPPETTGSNGKPESRRLRSFHVTLRGLVPNSAGRGLHNRLMAFGAEICKARRPRCGSCPLAKRCPRQGLGPLTTIEPRH